MDDCVDSIGEESWFSTQDANWGYQQVPIAKENRERATFSCQSDTCKERGKIIESAALTFKEARTKSLNQLPNQRNFTELRSFLWLCSLYRCFVLSYTDIAAPRTNFLKSTQPNNLLLLDHHGTRLLINSSEPIHQNLCLLFHFPTYRSQFARVPLTTKRE